jgi:hypothetical protein
MPIGTSAAPAAPDGAPTTSRRHTYVAVALAGMVLLLAAAFAWRWWTHAAVFGGLGDSGSSDPLPVADAALSTTVVFPKVEGSPEAITITDLDATFSANTAGADAAFWVCHMGATEDAIGAVHDPGSTCRDTEPFTQGMRFDYGVAPHSDYLFVTITPTRPGVAHVESVDIEYRRGSDHLYQHGTQSIRVDRKITAR